MRERVSAWRGDSGFTLIEVLVALAIVFVVFLGLTDAGLVALDRNIGNACRDEAVAVAAAQLEEARNTSFAALSAAAGTTVLPAVIKRIRGLDVSYGVSRSVNVLNADNLQVGITVQWTRRGKAYSHQIFTIVRRR